MLPDEHQGVGQAIERNRKSSALAAKHLFVLLELFFVFLKNRHANYLRGKPESAAWNGR